MIRLEEVLTQILLEIRELKEAQNKTNEKLNKLKEALKMFEESQHILAKGQKGIYKELKHLGNKNNGL